MEFPRSPDDRPDSPAIPRTACRSRAARRNESRPTGASARNSAPSRQVPRRPSAACTRQTRNHSRRRCPSSSTCSKPTVPMGSCSCDSNRHPPLLKFQMRIADVFFNVISVTRSISSHGSHHGDAIAVGGRGRWDQRQRQSMTQWKLADDRFATDDGGLPRLHATTRAGLHDEVITNRRGAAADYDQTIEVPAFDDGVAQGVYVRIHGSGEHAPVLSSSVGHGLHIGNIVAHELCESRGVESGQIRRAAQRNR